MPSPAQAGQASSKLRLSQPEATGSIGAAVRERLDAAATGTQRNTLVIRSTTGGGKTKTTAHEAATHPAILAHKLRAILVVRDHQQTADYQRQLLAAELSPLDAVIYKGRTDVDPARPIDDQDNTVCYQMPAVSAVGARGHLPSASVCRMCPIGIAMGIRRLKEAIEEGRAEYVGQLSPQQQLEQRRGALDRALEGSRMDADTVDRIVDAGGCILHRAMPTYRATRVLLMTQQAYVDSIRVSEDDVPAIVIADEGLELAKPRETITGTIVDEWRTQVRGAAIRTGRMHTDTDSTYADVLEALRLVDLMRVELGQQHGTLERFGGQVAKLKERYDLSSGTAWWERPEWSSDGSGRIVAPLRAICDLHSALSGHTTRTNRGGAVTFAPEGIRLTMLSPIGTRLVEGDAILLDATISDTMIAALRAAAARFQVVERVPEAGKEKAAGQPEQMQLEGVEAAPARPEKSTPANSAGQRKSGRDETKTRTVSRPRGIDLLDIEIVQHIRVLHVAGIAYSRGLRGAPNYDRRMTRSQRHFCAIREAQRLSGRRSAILTSKCFVPRDEQDPMRTPADTGWWGAHDRAHNRWVGHDLIIHSLPWRSQDALQAEWDQVRAFDPRRPAEPPASFAAEVVGADLVQAIGRARAIYADPADPIRVTIMARVPAELAALLERAGLAIVETRKNPLFHGKRTHYDLAQPLLRLLEKMKAERNSPSIGALAAGLRAQRLRFSTETLTEFCRLLVTPDSRGAKKLGYGVPLVNRYLAALLAWMRRARLTLERKAESAAKTVHEDLRGLVRRCLIGLGGWMGWDPRSAAQGAATAVGPPLPSPV